MHTGHMKAERGIFVGRKRTSEGGVGGELVTSMGNKYHDVCMKVS